MTKRELDVLFGSDSTGDTPEERAKTSRRMFVRSQDEIGEDRPTATGMKLTAEELVEIFDERILLDLASEGQTIIVCEYNEPAASITNCRNRLGWNQQELARRAGLTPDEIADAENSDTRTSIWTLDKICRVLCIDTRRISYEKFS